MRYGASTVVVVRVLNDFRTDEQPSVLSRLYDNKSGSFAHAHFMRAFSSMENLTATLFLNKSSRFSFFLGWGLFVRVLVSPFAFIEASYLSLRLAFGAFVLRLRSGHSRVASLD